MVGEVTDFARLVHGWPTGILRTSRPARTQSAGRLARVWGRTQEVERVADYIRYNPVVEGFVATEEDYLYSSAHDARLLRLEEA